MVYPELCYDANNIPSVQLIDTQCNAEDNPILELGSSDESGDTEALFMILLQSFLNQYANGYEDGYDDALYDEEGDINNGCL